MRARDVFGRATAGVAALCCAALAGAQSSGAATRAAGPDRPSFAIGTDLVIVSAIAIDDNGRPVTDMRQADFRVWEDGRPQMLRHFSAGRSVAARLLLLVDASGSMTAAQKSASVRMAVLQVLSALDPEDEVALAGFDDRYWGVVPFTRDREKILAALDEIKPFGSTALHDALGRGASDLASHGEGRRAVVVITDGVDTASQKTAEEVIERSRALDVPIYAVSVVSTLDDPGSDGFTGRERPTGVAIGRALLDRYARLSGGAAFTVSDFGALRSAALRIVGELKHQYRLGYDPPPGPPRFRRVEVRATRKGVVVKARSGYVPGS